NTILKELTFDQPTSWLATELGQDLDLWNREWVIEELAKRPADASALAALARAATSADYFLTRAQAAEALARFPAAGAAAPLATALRDSSAQVRRAAITALGGVGGARAAELARTTWRADASYETRAAGLAALAARGSAHALNVLAAHLDDERAQVRRWTVEAFQFTLPRELAIPRLKTALAALVHRDAKQRVQAALQRLEKPASEEE